MDERGDGEGPFITRKYIGCHFGWCNRAQEHTSTLHVYFCSDCQQRLGLLFIIEQLNYGNIQLNQYDCQKVITYPAPSTHVYRYRLSQSHVSQFQGDACATVPCMHIFPDAFIKLRPRPCMPVQIEVVFVVVVQVLIINFLRAFAIHVKANDIINRST